MKIRNRITKLSLRRENASVLIIVLWISIGLVSIALYFAHSMTFELRASDNRTAGLEAEQAIDGGARYVNYVLSNFGTNGVVPDPTTYQREAVPVGQAMFWLIGRSDRQKDTPAEPFFGLVDEASKLNLNTATTNMLEMLPRMTPELAAAIMDWRDSDSDVSLGGAESETYNRLQPAYNCKNAPFETVDELRLVYGATLDILYGEDANLNGVLDLNENDGPLSLPDDNRDARLDPGILEYVTVYSRQPNLTATRTNVNTAAQITNLLSQVFGASRARQIARNAGFVSTPGGGGGGPNPPGTTTPNFPSLLDFYITSQMTADEFLQIATNLCTTNVVVDGLINVNTAGVEVLACVPGIGTQYAQPLVAYRQSNPNNLYSIAWVMQVLDSSSARQAGRYLTTESYQFSADIAAVGHYGRGYRRTRFVFDTSDGTPRILYRQDLTRLGWALGNSTRQRLPMLLANATQRR